ncbi:MAG: hypothetical protein MK135_03215, partial [Polyangiaceae bacterium]|nr:hypothetical protein [Polyangiaceae bacterium]
MKKQSCFALLLAILLATCLLLSPALALSKFREAPAQIIMAGQLLLSRDSALQQLIPIDNPQLELLEINRLKFTVSRRTYAEHKEKVQELLDTECNETEKLFLSLPNAPLHLCFRAGWQSEPTVENLKVWRIASTKLQGTRLTTFTSQTDISLQSLLQLSESAQTSGRWARHTPQDATEPDAQRGPTNHRRILSIRMNHELVLEVRQASQEPESLL